MLFRFFAALLALAYIPAWCAPVTACADQAEMPPFTYAERVNGHKTDRVVGVSVDLLQRVGQSLGWEVQVQLLPWARCLALVAEQRIQIALNVGAADAQGSDLLLSQPIYTLHSVYFYSKRARPDGLSLTGLSDLRRYHLCGLGGHRFEPFGIPSEEVDRGTVGYEALIAKLHAGRCDLFIETREAIGGMYLINPKLRTMLVDGTLISKPLPGAPERALYFAVSRRTETSLPMLANLNKGLERAVAHGEVDALLDHYLN